MVVIHSVLTNICTWLPVSLFLCLPALSAVYLHTINPWVKQQASIASSSMWNGSMTSLLCVVFFAREKMRVFAKEKTLFFSLCCLWSPPVVYMVKISGTYNPATECSQSHMWPGQTHTHWRVMARLLSQGWQVSTIMFSLSLTLFFSFSPCLSSKLQFKKSPKPNSCSNANYLSMTNSKKFFIKTRKKKNWMRELSQWYFGFNFIV